VTGSKGKSAPARDLTAPGSLSPQARDILRGAYAVEAPAVPDGDDLEAWRQTVAAQETALAPMAEAALAMPGATLEERIMGGVRVYVARPETLMPRVPKAHLNIHGGGWVSFGGKLTATVTKLLAEAYGGAVFGVDYRGATELPAPASLDDCLAAYSELLKIHPPKDILVSGDSAGANLAAALMHRARDAGLPRPGALFLNTPAVDLTLQSDSLKVLDRVDPRLKFDDIVNIVKLYTSGGDLGNPYISPINGDLGRAFPPTYLRTGTRDLLLSDTVRMHAALRKAGVEADLYVGEGMPHGGFDGMMASTPEDADARADLVRWIARHFG
jgi:acetyl esterase/lipase